MQTVAPSNGQYHSPQSDYPEAIRQPPAWHGSTPKHTCTLSWQSPTGLEFCWTVNTDNPADVLDLAIFVERHRKLDTPGAPEAPEANDTPVDTGADPADHQLFQPCPWHGDTMRRRAGKNGSHFYSHQYASSPSGWCNGRS